MFDNPLLAETIYVGLKDFMVYVLVNFLSLINVFGMWADYCCTLFFFFL